MICICIIAWFCYPETRGYSLEEIARVFDKDTANPLPYGAVLGAVKEEQMEKSGDKADNVDYAEEEGIGHRGEMLEYVCKGLSENIVCC